MNSSYLANVNAVNQSQKVADYFVVVGLPAKLTALSLKSSLVSNSTTQQEQKSELKYEKNLSLYPNYETPTDHTKKYAMYDKTDPIVDLVILDKTMNESVPIGYECIWLTKAGHSANLNHSDSLFKSHEMFICYRRGRDKPPITDIGVLYENSERVMSGCTVIKETVGKNSANINNSSFSNERTYITYRRSNDFACNSLACIDICVIIKSKGESAPHTFNEIPKNLNKGIFGASVYLCYKKAWIPAPQIKYLPTVLYRYPSSDHVDLPFPSEVAMFGLPMGAVIESWPRACSLATNKPSFSTFVLNVTSDDGSIMEKVYGASLMFYESFDDNSLTEEQSKALEYIKRTDTLSDGKKLYSNKCLLLLSRHALFETLKEFLVFLYNKYTKMFSPNSLNNIIPIEKYLRHLIFECPFPTYQKPRVLVNLSDKEDDCLSVYLPDECILPQSGASFIDLLKNFGVENSINVFLFILLQRNVMVHSLRRAVLTGVIEAISCIIFPFMWRYSYLPMCPLNLCQLIEAPGSFILGMDSRYFDLFDPPDNVICVDLDTNTISWTPDRNNINLKILPKKSFTTLRNRLFQLQKEIDEFYAACNDASSSRPESDSKIKRKRRQIDLAIRETFLKFMASILHNYKQFLRTVTRRPDIKAMDRNLATFFDCEGFVLSKDPASKYFFKELIKTQLFYDCIMNLTFATELEPTLADAYGFFADCCSKFNSYREEEQFLELNESTNHQTIVVMPPTFDYDQSEFIEESHLFKETKNLILIKNSEFVYNYNKTNETFKTLSNTFPRLKIEYGIQTNSKANSLSSLSNDQQTKINELENTSVRKDSFTAQNADTQSLSSMNASNQLLASIKKQKMPTTPIGVRTKAEKLQSQKKIDLFLNTKQVENAKQQNNTSNFNQAKTRAICLLSNAYALWFIYLAECLKLYEENRKNGLNYAYQVLIQMQNHNLKQPDEICYRTMMQLCLLYKLPTLAVKTLLHMKIYKIELTPITYSYYNMALLDPSNWPSFEQDKWAKLRLIWSAAWRFKHCLKLKHEREEKLKKLSAKKKKSNKKTNSINRKKSSSTLSKKKTLLNQKSSPNSIRTETSLDTSSSLNNKKQEAFETQSLNEKKSQLNSFTNQQNDQSISSTSLSTSSIKEEINISNEVSTLTKQTIQRDSKANNQRNGTIYNEKSLTGVRRQLAYSESDSKGLFDKKIKIKIDDKLDKLIAMHLTNKYLTSGDADLITNKAGILNVSLEHLKKILSKSTNLNQNKKKSPKYMSQILASDPTFLKLPVEITFLKEKKNQIKKSSLKQLDSSVVIDDPLSAFSKQTSNETKQNLVSTSSEINKRLFDYKPFQSEDSQQSNAIILKSDFLYEKEMKKNENYLEQSKYDLRSNQLDSDYDENDDIDDEENEYDDDDEEEEENDSDLGQEEDDENFENENEDSDEIYDEEDEDDEEENEDNENYRAYHNRKRMQQQQQKFFMNGSGDGSEISSLNKNNLSNNAQNQYESASISNCLPMAKTNTNQQISYSNTNLNNSMHHSNTTPLLLNNGTNNSNSNINLNFNTPNKTSVTNKITSFMRKMENSLEFDKFKGVMSDLKEVIITNTVSPLNQQEIANKLKSISSYQINPAQYLNGLVKNNTNLASNINFNKNNNNSNESKRTPSGSYTSLNNLDKQKTSNFLSVDLETIPDDSTYKTLNFKWWGIDVDGSLTNKTVNEEENDEILIDIQITSCNHCETCQSFIYDEEIMSGWSFNDSDLNVRCSHCSSLLVPKLYVTVKDLDTMRKFLYDSNDDLEKKSEDPLINSPKNRPTSQIKMNMNEFSIEYLSPLVVRKEIENIICNKNNTDDECLVNAKFMDEHAVIYWNLIWYFKRIGVDGSNLIDTLLNSRIDSLRNQLISQNQNEIYSKKKNFTTNFLGNLNKPFQKHPNVKLKCMWDNLKLKNSIKTHETPLYLSWLNSDQVKIQKEISERLITVLTSSELKSFRKSSANPRSLSKLFELIIRNIKECEVGVPIKNMLRERCLSRSNYSSIYREILFLVLVALERYLIDIDVFDNEYRAAYKRIMNNEQSQDLLKPCDKPPNDVAIWSRRLFSPLLL